MSRVANAFAAAAVLAAATAWWLWPVELPPRALDGVRQATTTEDVARATAATAEAAAERRNAVAAAPDAAAPAPARWTFAVRLHCRPFGAERSAVPRFGPIEAGAREYATNLLSPGEREFSWRGRSPQAELVFDSGHLRRVQVRSGVAADVSVAPNLRGPSLFLDMEAATAVSLDGGFAAAFWEAGRETKHSTVLLDNLGDDEDVRDPVANRPTHAAPPPITMTLRGRVVDPGGAPIERARMLWCSDTGDLCNGARSAIDGSFAFDHLPATNGQLWACAPGFDVTWPVVGRRVGIDEEATLVLDPAACTGSLALTVQRPDDVGKADVTVRVWQRASGLGLMARPLDSADGSLHFALDRFPPGDYTIEVLCPGFGVVPGGTFASDGHAKIERTIALPASCLVTVVRSTVLADFALVRVTPTCDLRIELPNELPGPFRLGPGDYAARWRDATGDHELAFAIPTMPPATRTVTLP